MKSILSALLLLCLPLTAFARPRVQVGVQAGPVFLGVRVGHCRPAPARVVILARPSALVLPVLAEDKETTYTLAPGVLVVIDGVTAKVEDLKPGMDVRVECNARGEVVLIIAKTR